MNNHLTQRFELTHNWNQERYLAILVGYPQWKSLLTSIKDESFPIVVSTIQLSDIQVTLDIYWWLKLNIKLLTSWIKSADLKFWNVLNLSMTKFQKTHERWWEYPLRLFEDVWRHGQAWLKKVLMIDVETFHAWSTSQEKESTNYLR